MIKGHTKIELTNVKTGQKKVIEDTNMVTNGMSNFLMSNPYNYQPLNLDTTLFSTTSPRSYQLCGGLLLFNKQITEDPDMIFPPEGNKMIGNAVAGISSGQNVPEFGYFDAPNSTFEWNGDTTTQKFVFDFGTSQGNGEISSVCLASLLAGYMGFGNHSNQRVSETIGNLKFGDSSYNPFGSNTTGHYSRTAFYPRFNNTYGTPFLIHYKKNCIFNHHPYAFYYSSNYSNEHFSTTGTLKLTKQYCPLSSWNPLQYMDSISSIDTNMSYGSECTVSIPSEIMGLDPNILKYRTQVFHSYDGTYLIVGNRKSEYLEPDDTIYVLHVNADLETKLYTLKNTSGVRLLNVYPKFSGYTYDYSAVKDGYLIAQTYNTSSSTTSALYKINLNDSTDITEISVPATSNYYNLRLMSDRIYVGSQRVLDTVENVALLVNSQFPFAYPFYYAICGCKFMYMTQYRIDVNTSAYCYLEFNPMYLATINNLSEPVVKTSDLTMKITYTLTCTEEGDQEAGDS